MNLRVSWPGPPHGQRITWCLVKCLLVTTASALRWLSEHLAVQPWDPLLQKVFWLLTEPSLRFVFSSYWFSLPITVCVCYFCQHRHTSKRLLDVPRNVEGRLLNFKDFVLLARLGLWDTMPMVLRQMAMSLACCKLRSILPRKCCICLGNLSRYLLSRILVCRPPCQLLGSNTLL